jgi:hypothetical protein
MNIDDFNKSIAILCAWREARSEGEDGMRAVLHVIDNRAKDRGKTWAQIVYQRLQFTSMTYGPDPEMTLVPIEPDNEFDYLCSIVDEIYDGQDEDNTLGATNYFADYIPVPSWARSMIQTVQIGKHIFYK